MKKKRSTRKRTHTYAVTQLGWLLEPDDPPEHTVQFVLSRHRRQRGIWNVCAVSDDSRKYYTYLFVLSALAHHYYQEHGMSARFRVELKHDTYGQVVRYLYNMMGKSTHHYAAVDSFLRRNIQAIFDRSTKGDKNISFVGRYRPDLFLFGKVPESPSDVTEGPHPKKIKHDRIDFEQIALDDKYVSDLVSKICNSSLWQDWAQVTKGRPRRKRTGPVHEDLWYLRRVEDVLEMYDEAMLPENALWFRKSGPIAVDFAQKTVYIHRSKLARLKSQVAANHISLLLGPPASGKTVLALNLACELCKTGKTYYFDCEKIRDLDGTRLLSDLRAVKGTVIIDNVHLAPQEFQTVYSAFKHDKSRRILFTSRSTLSDCQYSRSEDLTEAKSIDVEPIKAVDKLVDSYCAWHKIERLSPDTKDKIKEITSDNLWLLAYLLDGYRKADGKGDPSHWLKDGVLRDLQDLENTDVVFPEVLVAISALYRNELLMAEGYLTNNLSFSVGTLNSLSQRGEIVRHDSLDGEVLYGLPHMELARAYWQFGSKYKRRRNLTDYESIVHQYVSLGPSNGLRALAAIEETARERLMARLEKEGRLTEIISGEQSTRAVGSWLAATHTSTIAREDVLNALAGRIEEHDHAIYIPDLLIDLFLRGEDTWNAFTTHLNCERLAHRTAITGGTVWIGIIIFKMFRYDEAMMSELYGCVDFNKLLRELNETDDTWTIGRCVSAIFRIDPNAHKKLKAGFDWQGLSDKLCGSNLLWSTEQCIREIMYADPNAARMLCSLLSVKKLVKAFDNSSGRMTSRSKVIATIWRANHTFGEKLWRAYRDKLGREMSRMKDPADAVSDLRAIGLDNPKMAQEMLDFLDCRKLLKMLSGAEDLMEKVEFARWFLNLKKAASRDFWKQYKHNLAASLSEPPAVEWIAPCLREISSGEKKRPYELCSLLKVGKMADSLNSSVDFWATVDDIVATVLRTHNRMGQELWKNINCEQAPHPKGRLFSDIWGGLSSVQDIRSIDQDIATQLCAQLDIRLLADRLSQASSLFVKEVGEWINTMHALLPARGKQLWEDLDKKRLAATLSSTDDVAALASCLEQVYAAQEQEGWIEELCMHVNPDQLAFTLKHTRDEESRERLLRVISKCCPTLHKQLTNLLSEP